MELLATAARRAVLLTLLAAIGAAAWSWWHDRTAPPAPAGPPEWPPLPTSDQPTSSWVAPLEDGSTPDGYPVKVKESSGIYHVPGGRFHERTRPDRCYVSAAAAEADGYRRSKT